MRHGIKTRISASRKIGDKKAKANVDDFPDGLLAFATKG
jgi:hypothetical protein